MSQYLLNLQRAIAQTHHLTDDKVFAPLGDNYFVGWYEAAEDLTYGISCGSEHAVKLQMTPWLMGEDNPYYEPLDSESDKGYCERIKAIQLLMEKM